MGGGGQWRERREAYRTAARPQVPRVRHRGADSHWRVVLLGAGFAGLACSPLAAYPHAKGPVVAHVMVPAARVYYNLEELWAPAGSPALSLEAPAPATASSSA